MRNIKALAGLMAVMAMTGTLNNNGSNDGSIGHGIPDAPNKIIPKGCKLFNIKGIEVIALTKSRAVKKVKRLRPDLFSPQERFLS